MAARDRSHQPCSISSERPVHGYVSMAGHQNSERSSVRRLRTVSERCRQRTWAGDSAGPKSGRQTLSKVS